MRCRFARRRTRRRGGPPRVEHVDRAGRRRGFRHARARAERGGGEPRACFIRARVACACEATRGRWTARARGRAGIAPSPSPSRFVGLVPLSRGIAR
ncbi:hypothetical protein CF642_21845 [Burkholderia pseudomallei]|nr:hypothetical protein CF642_21845 [Burkholderia pseudomallei]